MNPSLRLGRIAGVEIGVNWSWLVVFALIVWTLADGVFPSTNPGLSSGAHLAMATAAAVLFFVSLLLHELGHALRARREGVPIEGITLWLFGGVALFRGRFPSAGAELRIAIGGPLLSLALGVGLVLLALVRGLPQVLASICSWLGYINLVLLVFNMVPALPLDGGRVLRALLWRHSHDFARATRSAAAVGRAFGYAFVAGGLALFIFQGTFSGAWLAFIGWFLLQAASAEDRWLLARRALRGLRVRDLVVRDPVTARPDVTIAEFIHGIDGATRHTTYPVTENGHAVGLLPLRRIAEVPRSDWEQ